MVGKVKRQQGLLEHRDAQCVLIGALGHSSDGLQRHVGCTHEGPLEPPQEPPVSFIPALQHGVWQHHVSGQLQLWLHCWGGTGRYQLRGLRGGQAGQWDEEGQSSQCGPVLLC